MSNDEVYASGLLNRALDPESQPEAIQKFLKAEIDLLRDMLVPGMRVLDVGCGTGRHLLRLGERLAMGVGVDYERSYVADAERQVGRCPALLCCRRRDQDSARGPVRSGPLCHQHLGNHERQGGRAPGDAPIGSRSRYQVSVGLFPGVNPCPAGVVSAAGPYRDRGNGGVSRSCRRIPLGAFYRGTASGAGR